jgi:hypothetical protein
MWADLWVFEAWYVSGGEGGTTVACCGCQRGPHTRLQYRTHHPSCPRTCSHGAGRGGLPLPEHGEVAVGVPRPTRDVPAAGGALEHRHVHRVAYALHLGTPGPHHVQVHGPVCQAHLCGGWGRGGTGGA